MSEFNAEALRELQSTYDLINPGTYAVVMVDRKTEKQGMCDLNGAIICPCVCDYAHTNACCCGNEVGSLEYKGLCIELRFVDLSLAEKLAVREVECSAYFKYKYFDQYVGLCIDDTTDWNYSEDAGMVEVEPGVKVSEDWAAAKDLDVYESSEDPKVLFAEFIRILSGYHELL